MDLIFRHANIVARVLLLIVGFGFHFIGQLYSVLNWEGAAKLGLQKRDMPREYEVYERAVATADILVGWTYTIAGGGLVVKAAWGYAWAWMPGGRPDVSHAQLLVLDRSPAASGLCTTRQAR